MHKLTLKYLLMAGVWILLSGYGLSILWSYSTKPGVEAVPPVEFPTESVVPLAGDRFTLIMLAHPKCPCTRASIRELDRLMTQCRGTVMAHVLFFDPIAFDENWTRSDLWKQARGIPGVSVWSDREGAEAARFRASTSGQVVVYDKSGALVFRGGITPGRGHSGDNFGRSAILGLVKGGHADKQATPVYGCPLSDDDSTRTERVSTCRP